MPKLATLPAALKDLWRWSVIYSTDWGDDCDVYVEALQPPGLDRTITGPDGQYPLWEETEAYESGGEADPEPEAWPRHHRKWCAVLDHDDFVAFVSHCDLTCDDVATMGSIGAPGCGFGAVPAWSFSGYGDTFEQNAYVTPLADGQGLLWLLRWLRWEAESAASWEESLPDLCKAYPDDFQPEERTIRKALVAFWGTQ